ncbi:hypothetical protein DESC_580018 [Desulfosarcina cetonica]|uniref:hypothetical protein n=1 Tax=Desulfosarcina cetonica TaxID=90730 RepID=UPI0006CFEBFF|nr:hypothetical protein [Desulfosarcina cetonica]VTR66975.1 hypothetical protein DESC_580018 [Desulfosarcina cetonica]
MMKRLLKAVLLMVRYAAYRVRYLKLYYWTEKQLFGLKAINPMPDGYYCFMYRLCMRLVREKRLLKFADWLIHRIPYNVRCSLA